MPTAITIADPDQSTARSFRVWTAPTLGIDPEWTEQPFLHVDRLALVAAPAIDECELVYHYGEFPTLERSQFKSDVVLPGPQITPLSLDRQFVKVELIEKYDTRVDGNAEPVEPTIVSTWYGIIEVDRRSNAKHPTTLEETGTQVITAFGLARLLDTTYVTGSRVQHSDGTPRTIGRGVPFNAFGGHAFPERGNRTRNLRDDDAGEYSYTDVDIFAYAPASSIDLGDDNLNAAEWTATQALTYLGRYHRPQDGAGDDLVEIEISAGASTHLDWYDITVSTERRSVKAVIDELIDRRRLVGYTIAGVEGAVGELFKLQINVFSFAESTITLPDGGSIGANQTPITLEVENSRIVEALELRRISTHQVDLVRVEGDYVTSTITLRSIDSNELAAGWSTADETNYNGDDDLGRLQESYADVWSRFIVPLDWDQQALDDASDVAGGQQNYYVAIDYDDLPDSLTGADVDTLFRIDAEDAGPGQLWHRGKRFLDYLAIPSATSQDSSEFRRPFVLFEEPDATDVWRYAELVAGNANRDWGVSLRLPHDTLGCILLVSRPGAQQLIAGDDWSGTSISSDPDQLEGLDWRKMRLTATLEWDERCRAEKRIATPEGHDRVRLIFVPDSRLDLLLPGTATDVSGDGALVQSNGEVLRDDRARLRGIAEAAAAWYGTRRDTFALRLAALESQLAVGDLVTKLIVTTDDITDEREVNTPITGIIYSVTGSADGSGGAIHTSIETSYSDADFV